MPVAAVRAVLANRARVHWTTKLAMLFCKTGGLWYEPIDPSLNATSVGSRSVAATKIGLRHTDARNAHAALVQDPAAAVLHCEDALQGTVDSVRRLIDLDNQAASEIAGLLT